MNLIKNLYSKFRHIIRIAVIVIAVFLLFLWVYWYNLSADLSGMSEREYINDSYQVLTDDITSGDGVVQPFTTERDIHGATFVFHTYDEQKNGTVTVELHDSTGDTLLSSGTAEMSALLNNTHHAILFDTPVYPEGETDYIFVVKAQGETEQDKLALWRSDEPVEAPSLTQNGVKTDSSLGFGIITNRADGSVIVLFCLLALLSAIAAVVAYLVLFVFKLPLSVVTIILVFSVGVIYSLVFPPRVAPDEEVHIHTAYYYSNILLGIENEETLTMRAGDTVELKSADNLSIFNYQQVMNGLFVQCEDKTLVPVESRLALSEPFYSYLFPTLGVSLARLFGFDYMTLILFGRLFNLAAFAAIMGLSVALLPRHKLIITAVALLPSCIHIAASFSYDCMVIALATLFVALCLNTSEKKSPIQKRSILLLSAVGFLLAPMKAVYVFITGFCRVIPSRLFKSKRSYYLSLLMVLGASFVGWVARFSPLSVFATTWEDVENAPGPVVDYVVRETYDLNYIITHFQDVVKLFFTTLQENSWLIISQLVGGEMGEPILSDLFIFEPIVAMLLILLYLSCITDKKNPPLLGGFGKAIAGICVACVVSVLIFVMYTWTPRYSDSIWGLQGRYFLPVLPLILLIIQNDFITIKKDITKPIILSITYCSLISALNVFQGVVGVLG